MGTKYNADVKIDWNSPKGYVRFHVQDSAAGDDGNNEQECRDKGDFRVKNRVKERQK